MPTIFTHPAVALALAPFSQRRRSAGLVAVACLCTVLPDVDVVAFRFGIPYEHPLGHRGFSHSLFFALLVGLVATWSWRRFADPQRPALGLAAYFTLATASHGLLDALTNGGRGVGFFIPLDNHRYFFPWRPIEVSPIGAAGFFERGWPVLVAELWWVWLPALFLGVVGSVSFRRRETGGSGQQGGVSEILRKR